MKHNIEIKNALRNQFMEELLIDIDDIDWLTNKIELEFL